MSLKVLHLDENHPLLIEELNKLGIENHTDYLSSKDEVVKKIANYHGIVVRSRFKIDASFLDKALNLKFIARVGAGLESIDLDAASARGIHLFSAPEGNRNAVAEHALGMLLNLFNKLSIADVQVRSGQWLREANRGVELDGKTVGIIGYGNMGKAFARKLKGFDVKVICYDIKKEVGDQNALQVDLQTLFQETDVLSLHTPWTPLTHKMINKDFIAKFRKSFWLINTARGKSLVTHDLVNALKSEKILGAGLDVLEYEKSSFEQLFENSPEPTTNTHHEMPEALSSLLKMPNVLFSPHVAGWTIESKYKLAQTLVDKIKSQFY